MRKIITKQFLFTILLIFILQCAMLSYVFVSFYYSTKNDITDLGVSNMKSQITMVENYLNKGENVLCFAAGSIEHFVKKGMKGEDLKQYMVEITSQMQKNFDVNFTGLYGLVNGEYIDGADWTPPKGYDPKDRDWYKEAVLNKGVPVMSSPYKDAQTGEIVISYSQMLSDGKSVVSLDIKMNEIQTITEKMEMGDMGYGFIVDKDGLVISHSDKSEVGENYKVESKWSELLNKVYSSKDNKLQMKIDGENCSIFTDEFSKGLHIVIVSADAHLFEKLHTQLFVSIILSVLVYMLFVLFCVISVKRVHSAESSEKNTLEKMKTMNMNIIRSLASTIDAKDRYTSGHSRRVADYSVKLAKRMGKSEEEQRTIYYAGLLHDVGKIRVSEDVINKPGRLNEAEFDQIRIHPVSGFHILHGINEDEIIGFGAKYHHERYDGKGYPNGLSGNDIPEIARIIAVADAYDAMASDRSYRKALPQDTVRDEIIKGRGTQFDPHIADLMLEIIDEDQGYNNRQKEDILKSILVVDDEEMIFTQIRGILKNMENIKVEYAKTVKDAFSILENGETDLIMLDLMMPESDGFTLFTEIRKDYDIPVIMMTGDKSIETIKHIRNLKIDDYLTKPFNPVIMTETIHGILHRTEA